MLRRYPHPVAAVWAALTSPELLARWWAPGNIAPVVGRRFTRDMDAWGQQQCEVLTVDHGTSISFLFSGGQLEGQLDTTITWRLERVDGGTILHFEHAGFQLDTRMGRHAIAGMGNGWPGLLARIDGLLADVAWRLWSADDGGPHPPSFAPLLFSPVYCRTEKGNEGV